MSGCKIGKVRLKSGGADLHVIKQERTHYHNTIENAAKCITPTTHAIGFFVLDDDMTVISGLSHGDGFTAAQLKGACEHMKDSLMDQVFHDE